MEGGDRHAHPGALHFGQLSFDVVWVPRRDAERLMVSISNELLNVATRIAQNAQLRLAALDQEEAGLDARKAEIGAERKEISVAAQRAVGFRPQVGTEFQCPRCWVDYERRARLLPVGGGTKAEDYFRCRTCGFEYAVTFNRDLG